MAISRGNKATVLSASNGGSLTWASNPTAGQKVLVAAWSLSGETISSVADNGVTPTTYTLDYGPETDSAGNQIWFYRADNITLPSAGSYTVTVTGSGGHVINAGGIAYTGVAAGAPTATNNATAATGTAVTTGSVTPARSGALFLQAAANNNASAETITLGGSGFTQQYNQPNGAAYCPGAVADSIAAGGPSSTSGAWTFSGSASWVGAIVTYDTAIVSVALTTPNVALAAPLVTPTAGATVALTTPNVALAAPAVSVVPFDVLPAAPLFPAGYTNAMVELDLSGTWTDVTPYTFRTPLTITRGHPDESTTTAPSQCTGTLTNEDARFTGTSPLSPYFGSLMRNVPVRVSLPEGASYLRLETDTVSGAQCPGSGGVSITGDTDIQVDVTLDNWQAYQVLACKWAQTSNERSWFFTVNQDGTLGFRWSPDGTNTSSLATPSSIAVTPALQRLCVRVTLAVSTGTVTFYTAPAGSLATASWTQLGSAVVLGAHSVFASTTPVQAGWASDAADHAAFTGISGKVHAMRLLSGIAGTVEASPDFTAQAPGTASFADAQSNTWTLEGTSVISNRKYRFHGELSVLPQQWAPTFRQVWCDFTAAGPLRRLAQGTNPVNSAFYRANVRQTGTAYPVAYWPCEDPAGSSGFASAVGGTPMTFGPATQLASNSTFACSAPIPAFNGAQWYGTIPTQTATPTSNVFRFICEVPAGGDTNSGILLRAYTTGTVRRLDLIYGTGGNLDLILYDINGAQLGSTGVVLFGINGLPLLIDVELNQSGSNIAYNIATVAPNAAVGATFSGTPITGTVGQVTSIAANPGALLTGTAAGHYSVQYVSTSIFALGLPLGAWLGETAGNRMQRLCTEEGITFRGRGQLSASAAMGVQTLQTLPDLLQECADTDRGIIFEPRQVLGLGYRCLNSIEAQSAGGAAAAVAWDFNQNEMDMPSAWPLEDDQRSVNDVTVTSATGSSSHQVLATGLMSVLLPPNGIGRYAQSYTVNPQSDSQLPNIGGWILHVGSVNEPRYPSVAADLANLDLTAALFYAILDADLGDLTSGVNPPAWLPPGLVRQIIQGTTETIFVKQLTVDWAAVPASPYDVGVVADPVYGHVDTDGSTVHAPISSSATTMQVDTAAGFPLWTTSAGDFPFDIKVNYGEVMTVTNITGASAGPSVVQSKQATSTSTTCTVTLTSPTTAGNCLVVIVGTSNSVTNATIGGITLGGSADNFGSLTSVGTGGGNSITSWWADPNCAGSQTSVVVTTTGGSGTAQVNVSVLEVPGLAATIAGLLDQDATSNQTSGVTTFSSGATPATSHASELWVGGVSIAANTTITGPSGGWTNLAQQNNGSVLQTMTGYQIVSSTGAATYAGSYTVSSGNTAGVVTLFAPGTGQAFTVTRGTNGVQVAHAALEDIRLAHPMIVALT